MTNPFARPQCLVAVVGGLLLGAIAFADDRKLGTIGPPPRQNPQRQTSGESVPPLPLPAAPLRRSEPKAEPSPPLFVGKLMYGKWQDYMPNPGDVDNLLRHVRYHLDAWYGWQLVSADEIVATYEQAKPFTVPMIYVSGYHPFELTEAQRRALREYVLDGGSIIADATLGSPAFADSFRQEMARIFPKRNLRTLDPDHPIYRSYYRITSLDYFSITKGTHSRVQGPGVLEGLNVAARTAVILSPYDLTCGWDEFYAPPPDVKVADAPRTMATMPRDAIHLGVNLVAYVAAERRFGKAQASTRAIVGDQPQRRAAMALTVLRHHGDWNADPNSLYQLIRLASQHTSMPLDFSLQPADPVIEQLVDSPIVILTGMDDPRLDEPQVEALRRHVIAGGFLLINNTSGFNRFDREARALIERIVPDQPLAAVPEDHELLTGLYDITDPRDGLTGQPRELVLEAVTLDDRAVIVYSPNDMFAMLKGIHDPYANTYDTETSRKLSLNVLAYAMQR